MKNNYPAYRVTKWLSGLDPCLEKWFEHFVELGDSVALVEMMMPGKNYNYKIKTETLYRKFSIWTIGVESIGNETVRNNNEEIIKGKILKEANGFKDALNKGLNKQEKEKLNGKDHQQTGEGEEERRECDEGRVHDKEPQDDSDGEGGSGLLETVSKG